MKPAHPRLFALLTALALSAPVSRADLIATEYTQDEQRVVHLDFTGNEAVQFDRAIPKNYIFGKITKRNDVNGHLLSERCKSGAEGCLTLRFTEEARNENFNDVVKRVSHQIVPTLLDALQHQPKAPAYYGSIKGDEKSLKSQNFYVAIFSSDEEFKALWDHLSKDTEWTAETANGTNTAYREIKIGDQENGNFLKITCTPKSRMLDSAKGRCIVAIDLYSHTRASINASTSTN